jgi:hypothetical protein
VFTALYGLIPYTNIKQVFITVVESVYGAVRHCLWVFVACSGVNFTLLRYTPEGRGFNSRWYHWNISLTQSFRPYYGPGVDSATNRNEYQSYLLGIKDGRCLELTTLTFICRL